MTAPRLDIHGVTAIKTLERREFDTFSATEIEIFCGDTVVAALLVYSAPGGPTIELTDPIIRQIEPTALTFPPIKEPEHVS